MDTQKIVLSTLAGTVVFFLVGYLIWGMALAGFHQENGPVIEGLVKNPPNLIFIAAAMLVTALLYSIIFNRWAGISTFATGAKAGALIAILMGLGSDLLNMGGTNMMSWPIVLSDVAGNLIWGALGGGVIGAVLGRGK